MTTKGSVVQEWISEIPFMQQTVLLSAIRGCDGVPKEHSSKPLVRWLRRCVLKSAVDGKVFQTPHEEGGGEFMRPIWVPKSGTWYKAMSAFVEHYLTYGVDEVPVHFHLHLVHAAEILGYKHPDHVVGKWWRECYSTLAEAMHVTYEMECELDKRLSI